MAEMTEEIEDPTTKLRKWGYRVEAAQEDPGFNVYFVEGFGIATYVRSDDEETLNALADEDAHLERAIQQDETHEETQLRWHEDPDREFELPEEREQQLRAMVSALKEAQPESKEE